jgi:hypothetical protein
MEKKDWEISPEYEQAHDQLRARTVESQAPPYFWQLATQVDILIYDMHQFSDP